ncbi:hypothetical protein LPC08_14235 [Roseomonas sp. OT10]|uniref:tripartite tricarboxylate transporter substrate-binding protein n=1 Tax=Roseomonas cutis TaxID=2897332 RepID=UPI001E3976D3|nr:tripartite tricarboxylate transporter substrate-binding protein [Roseomonas sp. OT10]UFN47186.1 hypothetical protein LPC08_14235 [Roseomonas sp. OT10]
MTNPLLSRRAGLTAALAAAMTPLATALAAPALDKVSRLIIGFPPGGSSDTVARLLAERLRNAYAPQVIVENRSGAGGRLAVETVKAAAPDGTTILQTPESILTLYPHIYPRTVRYDALADFVPVTPVCAFSFGFAVRADHPARDLKGFADWVKAQGGSAPFASPAAGSAPHFLGVQLAQGLGITLNHVPYRGTAPALQDLLAGQIPAVMCVLGEVTELYRAGQLRILGITAPERLPRLPDLPTFAELGQPTLTADEWFGLLVPARTPAPLVEGLHQAVAAAAARPDFKEALDKLEYRALTTTPAAFAERLRQERDRWGPIVRESGFKGEE